MSCDCTPSTLPSQIYTLQYQFNPNCSTSSTCGTGSFDAKCVAYKGVNLSCSGINTNDTIETALQKIDALVCQASGDYSEYNMHCLDDEEAITTESDFVDKITDYVCTLRGDIDTFINTTFVSYQTTVNNRFIAIEHPGRTCTTAGVTSNDSLNTLLDKYCSKFVLIENRLDLTEIEWDSCFTVETPPEDIKDAFSLLVDQICILKSETNNVTLPTFNNSSSCLSITGSADTLVNTINALKTRVCLSPVFDINALTWSCITKPSNSTTNLQAAFQSVITKISTLSQNSPSFSEDFIVSLVDEDSPCSGKVISLATPINSDRFVASDSSDDSPGTLTDKLQAGTNVSLDHTTTPGRVIINSTSLDTQGKVYADITDDTLGFLDEKLEGSIGDYITITTTYDAPNKRVKVAAYIDKTRFLLELFETIRTDSILKEKFCSLVASCPSPCQSPQNVQAILVES